MNSPPFQKKLLAIFQNEATEHLTQIANGLLMIEDKAFSEENFKILEMIHREAHSLKGAARAVELNQIELICQDLENTFLSWKQSHTLPTKDMCDNLHVKLHQMQTLLLTLSDQSISSKDTLYQKKSTTDSDTHHTIQSNAIEPKTSVTEPIDMTKVSTDKLNSLLLKIEELISMKLISNDHLQDLKNCNQSIRNWKRENQINGKKSPSIQNVQPFENTLLNLTLKFEQDAHYFGGLLDNLLDDTKKMMMIPFSMILDSFPLMVRNLSRKQEKKINLKFSGTSIEMDKRLLDDLKDPLMHMIRNSIDHGIEKPAERKILAKPETGTISILLSQVNSNEVQLIIADDGKGIDLDALKTAAIKKNYLNEETARALNNQEILSLMYLSGISTSPKITDISGQGLGMSIVQEKLEKIGGTISVVSHKNQGTIITLNLPLTYAIFKGVLVNVSSYPFVFLTNHLERVMRIPIEKIKSIKNKKTILINNESIVLVKLNDLLGLPEIESKHKKLISVVILHVEQYRIGFQVDDIQQEQEVLIKKLNKPFSRVKYISAITLLGNGLPVAVLNASDLVKAVTKNMVHSVSSPINGTEENVAPPTILVVEDSITTRTMIKNILELSGFTVATAVDGTDAWRILNETPIQLMVSDVEMPNMDGYQLAQKVREDKNLRHLPIILVTSRESKEDREKGIDVGANAYIVKSNFNENNLLEAIRRLI